MRNWYIEIFRALVEEDIRFVVAGGIAVNLLGVPRFTADLDLIVALDERNVNKFVRCMADMGYKPKVPVPAEAFADQGNREKWVREKNMRVFSFIQPNRPYELIDVFVKEPIPFSEMWREKENIRIENIEVPVVSIEHLLQLKQAAGREQDLSDIDALQRLQEDFKNEANNEE